MMHVLVIVNFERVNFPLVPLYAGQGSALKVRLLGIEDTEATAKLVLTPVGGGTATAHLSARDAYDNLEIYVPGWAFPTAGETQYEIVVTGSEDDAPAQWLGKGVLVVFEAATVAEIPTAPIIPDDTYVRNPTTGLYHLVSAEVNDLGEVSLNVSQEGVENVP